MKPFKKIKIANPSLDGYQVTYITSNLASGATSVSVTSTTNFPTGNFFVIIGLYGGEKTEIVLATSKTNNTITIGATKFSHEASEPVTYIPYNKIKIYGVSGGYNNIDTIEIDPTETFTVYNYEGTAYTSFATTYYYDDGTTTSESGYSDTITSSTFTRYSAKKIIDAGARKALTSISENRDAVLNWDTALEILQEGIDRILTEKRRWSFLMTSETGTLSTQDTYISKPDDVLQLIEIKVNGTPLVYSDLQEFESYVAGTSTTYGKPSIYTEKNGEYYIYPATSSAYSYEIIYYKDPSTITSLTTEINREFALLLKLYCGSEFAYARGNEKKGAELAGEFESLLGNLIEETSGPLQDRDAERITTTSIFSDDSYLV